MNRFSAFNEFVLRTPLFPVAFYTSLLKNYNTKSLLDTLQNKWVKNAIQLASPELLVELDKYANNPQKYTQEKAQLLEIALLKYISRISARATPFGLFAGCSTGVFDNDTQIEFEPLENFKTHSQFDMFFWINFLLEIGKQNNIREQLTFYPNSSLYVIGDFYRYVEYKFINKKREHTLAAIRKNEYVDLIFNEATNGKSLQELARLISVDESEYEEAHAFVNELVDNQFLVSNLEPSVTGNNDWASVIEVLKNIDAKDSKLQILLDIKLKLDDTSIENHETICNTIKEQSKLLLDDFDEKYLIQTDLFSKTKFCKLNYKLKKQLQQAIVFLGKIQESYKNTNLHNFKEAFLNRYETREMPLTVVLDSEIGIGYLQNTKIADSHPILDQFAIFKPHKEKKHTENWQIIDYILETKLKETFEKKENILVLKEEDFNKIKIQDKTLPSTFSSIVEVVTIEDKETIVLESLGNFSASKLLGRFCNGDEKIHHLTNEIINKETELNKNSILAEIVHLPESRTGNVLKRPVLRANEIPYLAGSNVSNENQININDLFISVKNNSIILRSKKHNKVVIPCLSNAHNYSYNALPIYQFLCDLQSQNVEPIYGFNWGNLNLHFNNFPRVVYKDVILEKAKWYVYLDAFKEVTFGINFNQFRQKNKIPRYVNIVSGDNTLLLDLEKEICFDILKNTMKKERKVLLEEFLFVDDGIVKDKAGNHYVNQFVFSFFKNELISKSNQVE